MRWLGIGLVCVTMVACSKAPNAADEVGASVTGAQGVAFNYAYDLRIPSDRVSAVQDAHASACEKLGPARCRITGLSYDVNEAGAAGANLSIRIAAPLARAFGRDAVGTAEKADGALVGAQISGTEEQAVVTEAAGTGRAADEERARLDRELARSDLPDAERAELRRQRAANVEAGKSAMAAGAAARNEIAMTPMRFDYVAGRGTGLRATLSDTGATAAASLAATLSVALWLLAQLGPPVLLLLAVAWIWLRWGRRLWQRAVAGTERSDLA